MKFNKERAVSYFSKFYNEILKINFTSSHKQNLVFLLEKVENDPNMNDIRWISYMLATTVWETAHTLAPIEEYAAKKGTRVYELQKKYFPLWKGRGYCQLTHEANYKNMSKYVGYDLVKSPQLALNKEVAYAIMSIGMVRGLFTGKKLSDYINSSKCDYTNARRIVNGTDRADKLAYYAQCIERILVPSVIAEELEPVKIDQVFEPEHQDNIPPIAIPVVTDEQKIQPISTGKEEAVEIEAVIPRITSGMKAWKTALTGIIGSLGLGGIGTWISDKYSSIQSHMSLLIVCIIIASIFAIVYYLRREISKENREKRAHELSMAQMQIRANPNYHNVEIK